MSTVVDLGRLREIVRDTDPRARVGEAMPLIAPMEHLMGPRVRRGALVGIEGEIARSSLAMALLAGVSGQGGWCGVVGVPSFGCLAAHEFGIRMETLALVPEPGEAWAEAVAGLLGGMDAVLVNPPAPVPGRLARRLAARARQSRCTLLTWGTVWEGTDIRVRALRQEWLGPREGRGRLRGCRITASAANRPRIQLYFPVDCPDLTDRADRAELIVRADRADRANLVDLAVVPARRRVG